MIEITKDYTNYGISVDKYYKKRAKGGFAKTIFNKNKILTYLYGAFFIIAIANIALIYNFFNILVRL